MHIHRLLCRSIFSEEFPKFVFFWNFFICSVTAYWISAPSGKWSHFNFIFNLGNIKQSGGVKSRDKWWGVVKLCYIFCGQTQPTLVAMWVGALSCNQKKISREERSWTNPLNELQKAIHYSFIKFCIYCISLWYEFFVH